MPDSLVQPLFAGSLDIVGDVHGEIDALHNLLNHLGYGENGVHPGGRRLVFLGDLIDRGPDSPAVIDLVARCVEAGNAQCVMGNHELNILRNERKHGNHWFFGEPEALAKAGPITPQKVADENTRKRILSFCRPLPLALERDALRIVHACWRQDAIALVRNSTDALPLFLKYRDEIETHLGQNGPVDDTARNLALQNQNPVKVLTSGIEVRADKPFEAGGKCDPRPASLGGTITQTSYSASSGITVVRLSWAGMTICSVIANPMPPSATATPCASTMGSQTDGRSGYTATVAARSWEH